MLIDFHTHIFPEKIAAGAIESLKKGILMQEGIHYDACTDGTVDGLKASMLQNNVDLSVTMPIATKVKQVESINEFAHSVNSEKIISFAAFYPEISDIKRTLENLKNIGFKGIKLHPEFQQFFIDSPKSVEIFKAAEELKLFITIHSGSDIGLPPPVHCTTERLKNLLGEVSGKYIIAAHLGGFRMWDEVEKYLVGTNIYFDTAFTYKFIDRGQYKRIIRTHGVEKILFGSDSPWEMPSDTLNGLKNLELEHSELEMITHINAEKILN